MTLSPEPETTQNQNLGTEHLPTNSDVKNLETEPQPAQAFVDKVSVKNLGFEQLHSNSESLKTKNLYSQSKQKDEHKKYILFEKSLNKTLKQFQNYREKAVDKLLELVAKILESLLEFITNIINNLNQLGQPKVDKFDELIDDDEFVDDAEMSFFDHLEELRMRIFYALIAIVLCVIACFFVSKQIVELLEVPAQGVKFVQLSVGEYFFVSLKTAGYSGILLASPFILYQIIQFVLPGLTRRERRFLGPIVLGSGVLFLGGLAFAYIALIPTALQFFISYGADVVESLYSIERYFEFVLLLMFFTGLLFQVPVIQLLLGLLGIVSSDQMLAGWRYVITGSVVIGAVVTPSVDPFTQCLLAGAVLGLYFGGVGFVKLLGR